VCRQLSLRFFFRGETITRDGSRRSAMPIYKEKDVCCLFTTDDDAFVPNCHSAERRGIGIVCDVPLMTGSAQPSCCDVNNTSLSPSNLRQVTQKLATALSLFDSVISYSILREQHFDQLANSGICKITKTNGKKRFNANVWASNESVLNMVEYNSKWLKPSKA